MGIGDKTVYFEFLDNDVPLGERARTIAYGHHGHMTILDPSALGNIDRFRQVNTKATRPDEVLDPAWQPTHDFIRRCFSSFARIDFVNYDDASVYGRVESGAWHYKNAAHYPPAMIIKIVCQRLAGMNRQRRWILPPRRLMWLQRNG